MIDFFRKKHHALGVLFPRRGVPTPSFGVFVATDVLENKALQKIMMSRLLRLFIDAWNFRQVVFVRKECSELRKGEMLEKRNKDGVKVENIRTQKIVALNFEDLLKWCSQGARFLEWKYSPRPSISLSDFLLVFRLFLQTVHFKNGGGKLILLIFQ